MLGHPSRQLPGNCHLAVVYLLGLLAGEGGRPRERLEDQTPKFPDVELLLICLQLRLVHALVEDSLEDVGGLVEFNVLLEQLGGLILEVEDVGLGGGLVAEGASGELGVVLSRLEVDQAAAPVLVEHHVLRADIPMSDPHRMHHG